MKTPTHSGRPHRWRAQFVPGSDARLRFRTPVSAKALDFAPPALAPDVHDLPSYFMLSTLRVAIRSLARRPAVVLVAAASLAIGIGVNSAVFSIVDAMFFRPPAVESPASLITIVGNYKDSGTAVLDWSDIQAIAARTPAFSAVSASMERGGLWRNGGEMTSLIVSAVGDNYFPMLGVKPALGHLPDPARDDAAESEPPILLTHWFWRERMGGRADIIGQRMEFRGHLWRAAAVLPPEFRGLSTMDQVHVWIPVSSWARYFPRDLDRGGGQFEALARLRPGASLAQAQAQLDLVAGNIEAGDSRVARGRRLLAASVGREMRERLLPGGLAMAAVMLVLLVACANVAAVLLARAETRRREIGLRLSLGAGRLALVRQFLTESAVLAVLGTGLGLLLATWLLSAVPALAPPSSVPVKYDFRIDQRLLLFAGACSLLTLLVSGMAPFGYALRVSLLDAISGARSAGRAHQGWLRFVLVSAQIALGVVLAGGAVLLIRALGEAHAIYPGYDASRPLALVPANVSSGDDGKPDYVRFNDAAGRVASVPGVEAVTYARHLPLIESGWGATLSVTPEGDPTDAPPRKLYFNLVGPRFFEITGTRMASGRVFADADHNPNAHVAIVNAEAARRFWPGQNPFGKVLRMNQTSYQVIGVTADGRIRSLHEASAPTVYLSASQMNWGETILIARTRIDPAPIVKDLARAAAQTHGLGVSDPTTLRTIMQQALYADWFPTVLGSFLAVVGLLLAAGGLYGAVSYATERRLGEFGVRMTLGARSTQIAGLVFREAAVLCAAGVPAGIGIFLAGYRYYGLPLFRGRPLDPAAILLGALITISAVMAGTVLPALRAARLDPIEVIRTE